MRKASTRSRSTRARSTLATLHALHDRGSTAASVGVQDFDPDVQRAVNRIQGEAETAALVEARAETGFVSLSIDLI
jgi:oxygen-independent coproporphyrinogen-3 oxidase